MTEDSKNKPTDIEQSIERIEALPSTALEELSYARKTAPGDMQAEAKTANWKDLRSKLDAARYRFLKLHKLNYEWQYSDDPAQRVSEYKIVVPVDLDHPDNADGSMSFDDAVDVLMEKDQLEKLSCARKTAPEDTVEILRAQNRELYAENDKLRQEIGFLRIKEKQAIDTQMYQSVWMQNDELQLKIRDLKAELATERAYRDSALALAKAIIRDVEGKI